jgi:two-component system osmolarity sensor histidine kinase EnvZ
MKFFNSLLFRVLAIMLLALLLSQAVSLYFLNERVTRPRQAAGIGQFVAHLKTIRAALETLPESQHEAFIQKIAERDGLRILPVREGERAQPAPDTPGLVTFRDRLHKIFGTDAEVYVRPGSQRAFWIRVPVAGKEYWIAFPRARAELNPIGALVGWGVAGLVLALLATALIGWWLTRPLQRLSDAAGNLGKGVATPPLPETGPTEVREVARAFNQMKEDLVRQEKERATFLAGVSHDLRTPLARLRLETEMLASRVEPETQRAIIADLEDMNAIIDQFIDFARSEAGEPLAPVNLSDVARGAAERAMRLGAGVRAELAELEPKMLRPLAIQRAVDNLVGNALKHAPGELVLRTARDDARVWVAVLDRGPGITPDQVARLKEPFTRKDEARSGSSGAGLGLAIADRVATMHGGRLELLPREGGGLEARLSFPAI